MSNETFVTLQGWLGSDVTTRTVGETTVASFRVGCTPRRFSRRTNEWYDGETQWYTVNAWRALGENCRRSLKRSDPVIVHGRLNSNTWQNRDGQSMTTMEVEATLVGHDLTRGHSHFAKTPKMNGEAPTAPAAAPVEQRGAELDDPPQWSVPLEADLDVDVDKQAGETRDSTAA